MKPNWQERSGIEEPFALPPAGLERRMRDRAEATDRQRRESCSHAGSQAAYPGLQTYCAQVPRSFAQDQRDGHDSVLTCLKAEE